MTNSLRFISISYKTASIAQREAYHILDDEKIELVNKIKNSFPDIVGLFLLNTCNRTEVYFESKTTTASMFCDFFISQKVSDDVKLLHQPLYEYSDDTYDTVNHLLKVGAGLSSSVIGDIEIVHQIKKAYQFSITQQLQGSLLERCMQTVFKSHKRISNETNFRDGTTSIAYKSLKVVNEYFKNTNASSKQILFIGAGDIVKQLFKYNSKFNFDSISISNRTEEKAIRLAKMNQSSVYDWNKVLTNDFKDIDVIISAVSNNRHLIHTLKTSRNLLLIDLAMPSNIDKKLADNEKVTFYDLDTISIELENTKERRLSAIAEVNQIISEELLTFNEWIEQASLRTFLSKAKAVVSEKIGNYLVDDNDTKELKKIITNRIIKRIIKQKETVTTDQMDSIVEEELSSVRILNKELAEVMI